ncbi:MAG TPA: hypothetical protein DCF63_05620 [Planctomycetaceae bacterium]|nr:hypothetical protein [Planctomycetaceae bacterium]
MSVEKPWIPVTAQTQLRGTRCNECGSLTFPVSCGCIVCGSVCQTTIDLSPSGTIESRTLVGERIVCEIVLDDGPRIMGWLSSAEPATIGDRVKFAPCESQLRFVLNV